MKTEVLDVCDQVAAALLNGVWQGILITLLVALGLRLLGPANAATRHAIWLSTLLLCVLLIPAQFLHKAAAPDNAPKRKGNTKVTNLEEISSNASTPQALVSASSNQRSPAIIELEPETPNEVVDALDGISLEQGKTDVPIPEPGTLASESFSSTENPSGVSAAESIDLSSGNQLGTGPAFQEPQAAQLALGSKRFFDPIRWDVRSRIKIPRVATLVLLLAWLVLATIRIGVLLYRVQQLQKIKTASREATGALDELFQGLRRKLGIQRKVVLKLSSTHHSPVLLGFIHPAIIVPLQGLLQDTIGETEQILRHELAHVRRRDDWVNLLQNVIQAAVFFHPVVPWISRRLSLEREIACDDSVLQQGSKPRAYALLLANLADRFQGNRALPAPGVSTSVSQLQQRISMILNTRRNTSLNLAKTRLGLITSTAAFVAALALYCGPRVVLAQNQTSAGAVPRAGVSANTSVTAPAAAALPAVPAQPQPGAAPLTQPVAENEVAPESPDAGPKFKPEGLPPVNAPHPVLVPTPALPPPQNFEVAVVAAPAPAPHGVPQPMIVGQPPSTPEARGRGRSLEERLERVERMLQELMAQRKDGQAANGLFWGKPGEDFKWHGKEMELLQQQTERESKKFAEKAAKLAQMNEGKMKERGLKAQKEALSKRLEGLHRSREMLQREMEKLEHEIEKIEQDKERAEDQENDDNDDNEDQEKETQ